MEILNVLTLVLFSAFAQQPAAALPSKSALEYQVKAAYIFNFVNFTEWPVASLGPTTNPFRICVAGNDPFGGALENTVKDEAVQGHPITVQRLARGDDAQQCQVLFVPAASAALTGELLRPLATLPILVIGESDAILRNGGAVSFVVDQGHVRFDVNRSSAEQRGVQLSSRLLRVARSVK